MKKTLSLVIMSAALLSLTSSSVWGAPKALSKEGIAPYKLSEDEKYLLESFGMNGTSQIISFHAPEESITMNVNAYRLGDDTWESIGGGGISIGAEREPVDRLIGNVTIQLREDYTIDFNVNCAGRYSFTTDAIEFAAESVVSAKTFLQEFKEIELNKEIPIALMVYDSGKSMTGYSLEDYFDISKLEGMDLVQVVTLEFLDEEL